VYGLPAQRRLQAGQMHAVFTREIRREHRPMKGWHLNLIEQPKVQRGQVAVADERLDVFGDQIKIQIFQ
jgi:hypothetical protein